MARNRILNQLLFWAALSLFALSTYSCSEPASPFGQTAITLEALDASCTEVWLDLKFSNLTQPANVAIQKDGKDYHRILSLNRDTLIVFENLNPSTNYSFRAIIRYEGKDDKISNTAPVRTMDTTRRSFTWQSWNFGTGAGTSRLNDIIVINKNNIWAVGFIKIDGVEYNAIHWNGLEWTLKQIPFTYDGITSINEIYSIYSLSDSTIIFAIGVLIILQNSTFTQLFAPDGLFPSRVNKLFASSLEDIYIAGNNGLLAYYNGKTWRKIATSAFAQTMRVRDIWSNPEVDYLYAVASSFPAANSTVIIKINKETLQTEELNPQTGNRTIVSCWFQNERKTFFAGDGFYSTLNINQTWVSIPYTFSSYKWRIRGLAENEIYMIDDFGQLTYFNGIRTEDIQYDYVDGIIKSLDSHDEIVGIVGISSNKAFISLIKIQE